MYPMIIVDNIIEDKKVTEIQNSILNGFFEKAPNNIHFESFGIEKTYNDFSYLSTKIEYNINLYYKKQILFSTGKSIARYTIANFIGRHRDWEPSDPYVIENKKPRIDLASVYYINDDYTGGEICFFKSKDSDRPYLEIKPKAGMCVFFDSSVYHETRPIISGEKYSYTTFHQLAD